MKNFVAVFAAVGTMGGTVLWWRRHPRTGAAWVNRVANPWLIRRGVPGLSKGEIGLLEHVGRRSGVARVTPVHPVPTASGFQIIVPLGAESQWARNVLAAGHCRLEVGADVHELDEPRLIAPWQADGLHAVAARLVQWLGFRYLVLRRFGRRPGTLEGTDTKQRVETIEVIGLHPELVPA